MLWVYAQLKNRSNAACLRVYGLQRRLDIHSSLASPSAVGAGIPYNKRIW